MQANFEIRTSITTLDITKFCNALFNVYRFKYGYMVQNMNDTTVTKVLFTLCGSKGLNKIKQAKLEGFVHGYFFGQGWNLLTFEWVMS